MELERLQFAILEYKPNSHRPANQRREIGLGLPVHTTVEYRLFRRKTPKCSRNAGHTILVLCVTGCENMSGLDLDGRTVALVAAGCVSQQP